MTPAAETIIYGWLFLLTLTVTALFAGWIGHRAAFLDLAKIFDGLAAQVKQAIDTLAPKPKRSRAKADTPIKLVPVDPPKPFTIDLTTPPAERVGERYASSDGDVTASPSFRGTPKKPEGDDPESAA
jgi:hypothetical protein